MLIILSITTPSYYLKQQSLPKIDDLKKIEFYSNDKTKYFELNPNYNENYTLKDISPHMINAILSVEDKHT